MFEKFGIDLTDNTVYYSFVDGALVLISLDYLGAIRVM